MSKTKQLVRLTPKQKWSIRISEYQAKVIMYFLQEILIEYSVTLSDSEEIKELNEMYRVEDFMFHSGVYECMYGIKDRILIQKHEAAFLYFVLCNKHFPQNTGSLSAIRDELHQKLISSKKPTVTTL